MTSETLVVLIDDDPAIHASLDSLFRSVGQPFASFPSTRAFLEAARPDVATCLVLDVRLPGQSGLEFQRELTRLQQPLPIIFITGHGDIPMSVEAMKGGAIEFLTKPFRDQDILDAVNRGLQLDRRRRQDLARAEEVRERYRSLTPRERDVLALVIDGRLNKEIAAHLDLSIVTVKVHRGHVMRKMGAGSVAELVRLADRIAAGT
tara:strand:+ start:10000 stop:10614 length:615 start_codon:yes stop_codon:yes gene_type:complete